MPDDRYLKSIEQSVRDIAALQPRLVGLGARLDKRLEELGSGMADKERTFNTRFWKFYAYYNLFIKLQLITENNFRYVETLSLLATARYVFEALVWIRVLHKDERYGLVAHHQLATIGVQRAKEYKRKMESEIQFYEELAKKEEQMMDSAITSHQGGTDLGQSLDFIAEEVDRRSRREFNLYADQARINGYLYQSHLLRQNGLPRVDARVATVSDELTELEKRLPAGIRPLTKQKWNWKAQAESVGMGKQYEFIYSQTSRMLHATPYSFATNQKDLEFIEVHLFLEYIYVSLLDSIETIEGDLGTTHTH